MCADCHARHASHNPECNRTAAYFHETITGLASSAADFRDRAADLAERGLDVDRLVELLGQMDDTVRVARSYIHTFDRSDFQRAVEPAGTALAEMSAVVDQAEATYQGRRLGLIVSAVLIAAFTLLVYLKLRRFERDH
jgi:hypothetical protein